MIYYEENDILINKIIDLSDNSVSKFGQLVSFGDGIILYENIEEYIIPEEIFEMNTMYTIKFPEYVSLVTNSAIDGFLQQIVNIIEDKKIFYEYFNIKGSYELCRSFKENIYE